MKTFFSIISKLFLAFIFTLLVLSISQAVQGQTFYNPSTSILCEEQITIEDNMYDVYTTNSGSEFVLVTSPNTGNEYPVWIGTLTDMEYEGLPVRQSKSGKYFTLKISTNTGNPYCSWIKEELQSKPEVLSQTHLIYEDSQIDRAEINW